MYSVCQNAQKLSVVLEWEFGGSRGPWPPKDAEVTFRSTALWLIHWLWNSSNKHLCLKCT